MTRIINLKKIFLCFITVLLFIAAAYIICKFGFKYEVVFSKKRLLLLGLVSIFIIFNFIFDYKKIWNFIFKYRYLVGFIIFFILVALGIHIYSLNDYNAGIQPGSYVAEAEPFWGNNRSIRSDEFLANTPVVLSQSKLGIFDITNPNVMAANGPILMFPKASSFNISIIGAPNYLGFLFLNTTSGYSFYSLLPYFIAFFSTFEFFLMMTKRNKILSLVGTLLLIFSAQVLWFTCSNYLSYGFICILLFKKLITSKSIWKKVLFSIIIGWAGACYALLVYPAWQIPFFYLFLLIAIWVVYENRNTLYIRNFFYLPISFLIAAIITLPAIVDSLEVINLLSNTVYPGARDSTGGNSWERLFLWSISPFYGVKGSLNTCEYAQFLCFYPAPIIIGLYQIIKNIKNKNNDLLLLLLVIFAILLNIWNFIPIDIFAKITLLNMSTPQRSQVVVAVTCILILVRWFDCYAGEKQSKVKIVISLILGLLITAWSVYVSNSITNDYTGNILAILLTGFFTIILFAVILNNKKINTLLYSILIAISIFICATVNPLSMGLGSIYNKPISEEINNISNNNTDGIWIAANANLYQSNFALANGAKIINSVNFYPQMELWKKIDPDLKYKNVYNRYAHFTIYLTNEESKFELLQPDYIRLMLNVNDLEKLQINYILSIEQNLNDFSNNQVTISKIYDEDGSCIYKIT